MDCVFCKIVSGEVTATIEYQNEDCVAFRDIHPQAKVHLLIIPKVHMVSVEQMEDFQVFEKLFVVMKKLIEKYKIVNYKIVINGGNLQEVKHLHLHLMSERG